MPENYPIDWRSLLSSLGVRWIDRGRNTSRDNVNINCPSCGDDFGYHMRISETMEIFNCWRDQRHGGTNFTYLLSLLGCSRSDAIRLLNDYRQHARTVLRPPAPKSDLQSAWNNFLPLSSAPAGHPVMRYLESRGFADPLSISDRYDLRYAPAGTWAMRLLIPLHYDGSVQTWTGRKVADHIEPRYKMEIINDPSALYIPSISREIMYIVEGPMDALKLAVACQGTGIGAVALCGTGLNASRLLRLQNMNVPEIRLMLDNNAPLAQQFSMLKEVAAALRTSYVRRCRLPSIYKDAGEASEADLARIVGDHGKTDFEAAASGLRA